MALFFLFCLHREIKITPDTIGCLPSLPLAYRDNSAKIKGSPDMEVLITLRHNVVSSNGSSRVFSTYRLFGIFSKSFKKTMPNKNPPIWAPQAIPPGCPEVPAAIRN
jgi:hypothetical protein